jgi:hypothetical protein
MRSHWTASQENLVSLLDQFWARFDRLMNDLPGAVDEAFANPMKSTMASITVKKGHATLNGEFKSLRINGYEVRVPEHVMRGEEKK